MEGMTDGELDILVERVIAGLRKRLSFTVEASGRHVHLCREHVDALFGKGHSLTEERGLSQPGEFVCAERVSLVGPKGILENVAILGPERGESQVELSRTDAVTLGVDAPVRPSGELEGSAPLRIRSSSGEISLEKGAIVPHRHIHMTPRDAALFGVSDGDRVGVRVAGNRPAILEDVLVRVSPEYALAIHIDYDEANACGCSGGTNGTIVRRECVFPPDGGGALEDGDEERGGLVDAVTKELARRFSPPAERASAADPAGAETKAAAARSAAEVRRKAPASVDLSGKRVLAERDVREACSGECGELLVGGRTIVTPLAMDWLRHRRIAVRRAGEGSP